jgi:hypothetical protein
LIADSGGAGEFRGGLGIRREYLNLADARFSIRSMKHVIPPNGCACGAPGRPGDIWINPDTERAKRLPTRYADYPLQEGDVFRLDTPGGGGHGDPLARDPERVARDVRDGKVGREAAERHYGVALSGEGSVDAAATETRRAAIRAERLDGAAAFGDGDRLGTVDPDAIVLHGAGGSVDVAEHDGVRVWACSSCGESLGPMEENFKRRARYRQRPPQTVDERMYPDPTQFSDTGLLLRQYACPGCAALLAQEFCLAEDEPWHDFRIDVKAGHV